MPEEDELMASRITSKSVDNCFMRLNVTITDSETPVLYVKSINVKIG